MSDGKKVKGERDLKSARREREREMTRNRLKVRERESARVYVIRFIIMLYGSTAG